MGKMTERVFKAGGTHGLTPMGRVAEGVTDAQGRKARGEPSRKSKESAILRIQKLLAEKQRRKEENALDDYKPHAKQEQFHRSPAKVRLFLGGNRSGKTEAGAAEIAAHATHKRDWFGPTIQHPVRIMVCGADFSNAVSAVLFEKLLKYIPKSFIAGFEKAQGNVINKINLTDGGFIKFMSFEQDVEKFEGGTWDYVWNDEPFPRDIWIAQKRGLVGRNGRALLTLTPKNPRFSPWIYNDLFLEAKNNDLIDTFEIDTDENHYVTQEELQIHFMGLTPEEIEARKRGGFVHLAYKILPIDHRVHIIDPGKFELTKDMDIVQVVDPHDRKPWAVIWVAIDSMNTYYVIREWPNEDFWDYRAQQTCESMADIFRSVESEFPNGSEQVTVRIMDPNSGRRRSVITGNSIEEEMAEREFYYDTEINDKIEPGHDAIRQRLYFDEEKEIEPKLFILNNCYNVIKGCDYYTWGEWRGVAGDDKGPKEKPREAYKDYPDCLRYLCITNPQWSGDREWERHHEENLERMRANRFNR